MKNLFFLVAAAVCLPLIFAFTPFNADKHDVSPEEFQLRQQVEVLQAENAALSTELELYKRDVKLYRKVTNQAVEVYTSPDVSMPQFRLCIKQCGNAYDAARGACAPSTSPTMSNCELTALHAFHACIKACAN